MLREELVSGKNNRIQKKRYGLESISCNAQEKFSQKRTGMISMMNNQISDYLNSEKENGNLH